MILLAEALRLFRSRHGRSFALASLAVAVSACAAMASEAGMARLAGGSFLMGSDRGRPDERPASFRHTEIVLDRPPRGHQCRIRGVPRKARVQTSNARGQHLFDWDDEDARIHKVQGHWRADPGFEQHPANEMTWYGARDYCMALGKRCRPRPSGNLPHAGPRAGPIRGAKRRLIRPRARYGVGWTRDRSGRVAACWARHPKASSTSPATCMNGRRASGCPIRIGRTTVAKIPTSLPDRAVRGGAADTGPETLRSSLARQASVSRGARAGHHNIGFRCAKNAE